MTTTERFPVLVPPRNSEETAPLGLFISVFIIAGAVYSLLSNGGMGGCLGGIDGEQSCVMIQMQPQSFVYLILAAIALISMAIIRRRQARALPTKTATVVGVAVMIAVGVAFTVYHLMWIQGFLIGDWQNTHDLVVPFLSNVTIDRTPW